MTLSLYSTLKALRRDAAAARGAPAPSPERPLRNSVRHALALLGMGVEGVSCGGDIGPRRHA